MRGSLMLVLVTGTLGLIGCDAFSSQSNVVATAAGRRLDTDHMVTMLTSIKAPVNPDAAEVLTDVWVNLNLFAEARVNGTLAPDSARVARVMWPQILTARIQSWQDTLHARQPQPTEASADSVYDAGHVRLFQHIIVTPAGTTANDTAAAQDKVSGLLAQIHKGGDFGALAKNNADASKEDKGFLPLGGRGQFVPEFESVAWGLEPGQVSDVVKTSFGFHLIRRAPKDEVRDRFLKYVQRNGSTRSDSIYVTELAKAKELKVRDNAGKHLKEAAANFDAARKNGQQLATYKGGTITVATVARWMEALNPGAHRQIANQPDSVLDNFIEQLGQNALVVKQMDSAKVAVPAANWQALQLSYRAIVDQLAASMALTDSVVSDSTLPKAARLDSASVRVSRFLDQLLTGQVQFRPLPAALAGYLRETGHYRVNRAGLTRAVELATAKWKADSAAGKTGPPPGIQPAPGGPPVQPPPADTAAGTKQR
jgi:PPIC-type PPIASE domain